MTNDAPPFRLKSIAVSAFLPTLLFSLGEGAIIPIIPIVADRLGASLAVAALIAAMIMVGTLIGDIPSGWLVSRVGERPAMIGAALVSVIGLAMSTAATTLWMLGAGILLVGLATAVFALARHAFMTSFVPQEFRARALSTLGGTFRLGYFVGPFIAFGVIHFTGSSSAVFIVHIVGCIGAAVVLLLLRDPSSTFGASGAGAARSERRASVARDKARARASTSSAQETAARTSVGSSPPGGEAVRPTSAGREYVGQQAHGLFHTMWINRGVLVKLGTGASLIGAIRASRQIILPLWAVSIGIGDSSTALIIGIAGAIDFALFYASGQIMDRFGRLASALPSMIGLGIGHIALAVSHDLPGNVVWFISVAMFLSLANGIGSGILMTLGADLADKQNPAPFLGAWRFTGDVGGAGAPLLVAGITAVSSIAFAAGAMGVLGLIGAGILYRYVPRYVPRVKRLSGSVVATTLASAARDAAPPAAAAATATPVGASTAAASSAVPPSAAALAAPQSDSSPAPSGE